MFSAGNPLFPVSGSLNIAGSAYQIKGKKEKGERPGVQELAESGVEYSLPYFKGRDTCLCSFVFLIILAVIGKCFPWE